MIGRRIQSESNRKWNTRWFGTLVLIYFLVGAGANLYVTLTVAGAGLSPFETFTSLAFAVVSAATLFVCLLRLLGRNGFRAYGNGLLLLQIPSFALGGVRYVYNNGLCLHVGIDFPFTAAISWDLVDVRYALEFGSTQSYISLNLLALALYTAMNSSFSSPPLHSPIER